MSDHTERSICKQSEFLSKSPITRSIKSHWRSELSLIENHWSPPCLKQLCNIDTLVRQGDNCDCLHWGPAGHSFPVAESCWDPLQGTNQSGSDDLKITGICQCYSNLSINADTENRSIFSVDNLPPLCWNIQLIYNVKILFVSFICFSCTVSDSLIYYSYMPKLSLYSSDLISVSLLNTINSEKSR